MVRQRSRIPRPTKHEIELEAIEMARRAIVELEDQAFLRTRILYPTLTGHVQPEDFSARISKLRRAGLRQLKVDLDKMEYEGLF